MLVCILECITVGWIYGTYYINDGCLISSRNLIFVSIWVHHLYVGGVPVTYVFGFLCLCYVFCFVCLLSVYCVQCLQLPIPSCPVGFLCLCCVFLFVFVLCIVSNVYSCPFLVVPSVFYVGVVYFCLSSFSVLCPMFPAAHSWLSRRFSMFVLCILFCLSSCCVLCPMFTAAHS